MSAPGGRARGADQKQAMDSVYAFHRHIYDFTRKFYLFGRDRLIRQLAPPPGGTVLEVGCGTARNLIVAAKRWPDARFYGFDISEAMLETAAKSVARHGLEGRITLEQGDAGKFDTNRLFGLDKVDRVFMSYTLSMIPPWQDAVELGAKALAPGGACTSSISGSTSGCRRWRSGCISSRSTTSTSSPAASCRRCSSASPRSRDLRLEFTPLLRGYAWSAVLRRA
ncbi:MAG: class I SAM-dependent methyltransferase [Sphingomonas sp.]